MYKYLKRRIGYITYKKKGEKYQSKIIFKFFVNFLFLKKENIKTIPRIIT